MPARRSRRNVDRERRTFSAQRQIGAGPTELRGNLESMHGYRVTLQHAEVKEVEASSYVVNDDGTLALHGGNEPIERWEADEWLMIDEFGTRLTDQWPPPRLDDLVDEVATVLGVQYGHYVHALRDAHGFEDWRCNDLDSLTSAILEDVGLTDQSNAEHAAVRGSIRRHFQLPPE